jgi:2-iminobutanoate/2-iminopropanoate deaminase
LESRRRLFRDLRRKRQLLIVRRFSMDPAGRDVIRVSSIEGVPYPRASFSLYTRVGNLLFLSGQTPLDPETREIPKTFSEQAHLVLRNIEKILASAGGSLDHVLKTTVYLKSRSYHKEYDEIYRSYFPKGYPARATVVAEMMHEDFLIEIEAIAWVPEASSPKKGET